MKIAIASDSKGEDSSIYAQAGRTPYFQIIEDGKIVDVLPNPFAVGGGGAGLAVTRMLSERGVNKIVAGQIGPKMLMALEQADIEIEQIQGKVSDYLK